MTDTAHPALKTFAVTITGPSITWEWAITWEWTCRAADAKAARDAARLTFNETGQADLRVLRVREVRPDVVGDRPNVLLVDPDTGRAQVLPPE